MRLRHIKGAEEEIARSPYVIQEPGEWKGRWNQLFGNSNPVRIEIGMGKGKFLMELAKNNPDINYIRVKFSDFLVNSRFLPYQHYHFVVFSALFCCIFLLYVDCTAALNFSRLFLIGRIYLFNVVTKLLCPNIFCNSLSSTLGFK